MRKTFSILISVFALSSVSNNVLGKVSSVEASRLGDDLTCIGAEVGGNSDGTIPPFSGKWLGKPPHVEYTPHVGQHPVDVYPDDKPLFEITAANVEQYADKLSDGQKAMFRRFPSSYRMQIYQTRRDFRYPDEVCEIARRNALEAELIDDGLGFTGYMGAIAFPIPKDPMELFSNMSFPYRAYNEEMVRDIADIATNGSVTWGRAHVKYLNFVTAPDTAGKAIGAPIQEWMTFNYSATLLPEPPLSR